MVTRFKKMKERSFSKRICISDKKIEKLLSVISPARYLEDKTEERNLFYNQKDPRIIEKKWIREYKRKLKEYNNYTNYNYVRNNHPNPSVFSFHSTPSISQAVFQFSLQKNHAL